MKIIRNSKEVFAAIEPLVQMGQYDSAKQQLEDIHIEFHDDAFVHLQVHRWLFRIARIQRAAGRMVGQIVPIIFAVPTSWVQRYIGLALPSRMKR
ncbi:MAG TPA: DUF3703 domain-containing protein [Spongiibacteraceae bacterium]|nr:DUF3703 domain-containing protein [Spongiibacteraceae bacterium]